jgi:hypothetical protein
MRRFVVALGAESDARFRDVPVPMAVRAVPTPVGLVDLVFRTRYAKEGYEAAVPREMWIDARGETNDDAALPEVINAYASAAASMLPMIASATNARIDDAAPKLAYDGTPGALEREYFTNFVREERNTLPPVRRIVNVEATAAFIHAAAASGDSGRVHRAASQYALGLRHATPGNETMALSHYFIGMEALTPVARRRELESTGCTATELATSWGIDDLRNLDAEVRRRILFRGDDDTASKARRASDGLEHSFLDFAEVRELAVDVVETTAKYLREAILEYSGLDDDIRAVLVAPPYDRPLHSYYARYMWGQIVGDGDDLAPPDQEYPLLSWQSCLKSFTVDESDPDRYVSQPEETMTARLGAGLSFRPRRWEIWGPSASGATEGRSEDVSEIADDGGNDPAVD